jgi:hypothetical protein
MAGVNSFEKFSLETLEVHFGQIANGIVEKVKSKKSLNEKSNISDIMEFIDLIELNIGILAGKNKAMDIGNIMRAKALEFTEIQKEPEPVIKSDLIKEIDTFLEKNLLPTEKDIEDYSKYLTLRYGEKARNVQKEIIEKVKTQIKRTISHNKIKLEINEFLNRFQQPGKNDIDDFINFIHFSKLIYDENELRDEIEKERLYRKFHGPSEPVVTTQINELVNLMKNSGNKDTIKKKLRNQELSYLIKDESGVSDKSISEFVELMTPSENDTKDTLEGLGLQHLITKK